MMSISEMIVAPVVVRPDMASKNESVYDGIDDDIYMGSALIALAATQERATVIIASRGPIVSFLSLPKMYSAELDAAPTATDIANGTASCSPHSTEYASGAVMHIVMTNNRVPSDLATTRILNKHRLRNDDITKYHDYVVRMIILWYIDQVIRDES